MPGRPVRGPVRRVHHARRQLRDPRRRAASGWCRWRTSTAARTRPRSGTARCSPRSGSRCAPNGSSAYAKVERRAGDWAVVSAGAAVWMDGDADRRRPGRAGRGRPEHHRHPGDLARRCAARRRREELYAAGRRARRARAARPVTDKRGTARVQAAPRRRADPAGAAHAPSRPRRRRRPQRRADHAGDDDRQRRGGHPRDRGPAAAGALPARRARADRHALGLRHQQLRHLRGLAGRRAGEVLHGAGRDGRRARGPHGRGPRAGRRARPGAAGVHGVPRPAVRLLHARAC